MLLTPPLVNLRAYAEAPLGKATASDCVVSWCLSTELRCRVGWGAPTDRDFELLLGAMAAELAALDDRYSVLFDARAFEAFDYKTLIAYAHRVLSSQRALRERLVRSVFLVNGETLTGATVAGVSRFLGDPFSIDFVTDPSRAFATLGHPELEVAVMAGLAELRKRVELGTGQDVAIRAWLRDNLAEATLERCARGVGLSSRSLQRRLEEASTTFRAEIERARIERAKELLRRPGLKISAIAREVGYSRAQSLSDAFRRQTGRTPSEWRAANDTSA